MTLSSVNFRTKTSKWHGLERRNSPLFLDVQNWEHLPYHFGLREESISQRRNAEKCPRGLEQLLQIKEVTIEKIPQSHTSFLYCKESCNNSWHILFSPKEGKKQQLLFHAEKTPNFRLSTSCILKPIEFGIYHPHPLKESKQQLTEKTAILHCSGFPTLFGGTNEMLINYVIQLPEESKSLAIPLGTIYNDKVSSCKSTLIAHHGLPFFQSAYKVCRQSQQHTTRCLKKLHHIVRCIDDKTMARLYKNCCSNEQRDKRKKCSHSQQKNDDR
ncbi:hypothetical protein Ocin01_12160, partial [Orchesella cincta]